jgi:cytochrome P450
VTSRAEIAFDPTTPEQRENPFDVLELARREQPVFFAPSLGLWVVTRHEDVLAVLKDHRAFSSSGALRSSTTPYPREVLDVLADGHPEMPYIIELDPPLHDRIRGLVARAFTPRRVNELEPRIETISAELIDSFAARGRADIVDTFAWPLPLRVLGELFGFPRDDLEQIHHWGNDWLLLQQERPVDELVEHARGLVELQRYCVAAVEERRRSPTDDLLGAMVAANDEADEPLTAVEIAGLPLDLMGT